MAELRFESRAWALNFFLPVKGLKVDRQGWPDEGTEFLADVSSSALFLLRVRLAPASKSIPFVPRPPGSVLGHREKSFPPTVLAKGKSRGEAGWK